MEGRPSSNEIVYLAEETSKQSVEGAAWFLLPDFTIKYYLCFHQPVNGLKKQLIYPYNLIVLYIIKE